MFTKLRVKFTGYINNSSYTYNRVNTIKPFTLNYPVMRVSIQYEIRSPRTQTVLTYKLLALTGTFLSPPILNVVGFSLNLLTRYGRSHMRGKYKHFLLEL